MNIVDVVNAFKFDDHTLRRIVIDHLYGHDEIYGDRLAVWDRYEFDDDEQWNDAVDYAMVRGIVHAIECVLMNQPYPNISPDHLVQLQRIVMPFYGYGFEAGMRPGIRMNRIKDKMTPELMKTLYIIMTDHEPDHELNDDDWSGMHYGSVASILSRLEHTRQEFEDMPYDLIDLMIITMRPRDRMISHERSLMYNCVFEGEANNGFT